ncbi:MAG: SH3 domain-containing protein [Chloroflexota bacterium]
MRTLRRTSLLIFAVLLAATACVVPNITITDPVAEATLQALTVDAAVRATQQAAGPGSASASPSALPTTSPTASEIASPTSSAVPSLTPSPTTTPTPVVIASPTPVVPMMSVSVATNCRRGPGKLYPIVGALLAGETAQVYARDPSANYWYIPNPDSPGDHCWVWGEYATFSGFTSTLPMFTPPPTPTATPTPTPAPGFDASYDGLVWCTSAWWTQIAVENTGLLTFRSLEFTLKDIDLDISVSDEADNFVDRPNCSSSTSKVSLESGQTVVISSPALDNDPGGHRLRARITLCSKTGQDGECVTETITFKP